MCVWYTSAHRELYISLWSVYTACVGLCWKAFITFSSIPTSIISISQSSLSYWGGGGIEVVEKHNLSNIKYQGLFSWSQQEGTEMFHCSAQQSPHIFSTAEPVIIQEIYQCPRCLSLSLSFSHTHTEKKSSQIGNQAQFKQIDSEADQTNKRAKLRCNHQNYLYQNEFLNYNSTWNIHFEQREL